MDKKFEKSKNKLENRSKIVTNEGAKILDIKQYENSDNKI